MTKRHKLLIIDDEPSVRKAIETVFSRRFEVITAAGGEEGVRKAREHLPDLILLDLVMSGMDGIATCRALRAYSSTWNIPVIVMTATNDDDHRAEALILGVADLVSKPFRPKEFMIRILNQLGKDRKTEPEVRRGGIIHCGNLQLDPDSFEASIDGVRVAITPVDFKLLKFFVRHKGIILSREQILNAVWKERDVSDRVVDNHILSLRKRLTAFNHEIVAVYGAGYGLRPRKK